MKKSAFWAVLALSLATTTVDAEAQGSWSGFYVGLETGIARNLVNLTDNSFGTINEDQSDTGLVAGAFAGYDHQIGDFVIGGVADVDYVGTSDLVFNGKANTNYDMDWVATARVRAGWAPNDQLLLFGTGGVSFAGVNGNLSAFGVPSPISSTETGYVLGAGAEYRFNGNWSVKGEYLHHDFGTVGADGVSAVFKPRLDMFKIGLAYRF
jgi:outer membrane immunogenic protein